MSHLAENLKVLLWKNKGELSNKAYADYIDYVAVQCHMSPEHFRRILLDECQPSSQEEGNLRAYFADYGYDLTVMRYEFLFDELMKSSQVELIDKNLRYLLSSLEWGENTAFIEEIGVNPSTVTRWKQGTTKPDKESQLRICQFFGYPDTQILKTGLLFLGLVPVSSQQRKQLCKKMIDEMDKEAFEQIYPALRKLLS